MDVNWNYQNESKKSSSTFVFEQPFSNRDDGFVEVQMIII